MGFEVPSNQGENSIDFSFTMVEQYRLFFHNGSLEVTGPQQNGMKVWCFEAQEGPDLPKSLN